jgi:hypothetical protein
MGEYILDILAQLIPPIILGIGTGLFTYVRKIHNINKDLCKKVEMLQKTIVILAKTIDSQVKHDHPDSTTELDELVRELLGKD